MGYARQAGFLAPHELPLRCVRTVELTSCVGHERQEGDAHLSMGKGLQATRGWARLAGWGEACRLCMGVDRDVSAHISTSFSTPL